MICRRCKYDRRDSADRCPECGDTRPPRVPWVWPASHDVLFWLCVVLGVAWFVAGVAGFGYVILWPVD